MARQSQLEGQNDISPLAKTAVSKGTAEGAAQKPSTASRLVHAIAADCSNSAHHISSKGTYDKPTASGLTADCDMAVACSNAAGANNDSTPTINVSDSTHSKQQPGKSSIAGQPVYADPNAAARETATADRANSASGSGPSALQGTLPAAPAVATAPFTSMSSHGSRQNHDMVTTSPETTSQPSQEGATSEEQLLADRLHSHAGASTSSTTSGQALPLSSAPAVTARLTSNSDSAAPRREFGVSKHVTGVCVNS